MTNKRSVSWADAKLQILSELVRHGPANFHQLQKRLGKWTKGEGSIYLETENVVLWVGMSTTFTRALSSLRHEDRLIQLEPCTGEDYAETGALIANLPIAAHGLDGAPYEETCWLPSMLMLAPPRDPEEEPPFSLSKVVLSDDAAEALAKLLLTAIGGGLIEHKCTECDGTGVVDGLMCGCPCHAEQAAREAKEQDAKEARERARRERGGR